MSLKLPVVPAPLLASLLVVLAVIGAGPGRAYDVPVRRDDRGVDYILDNYLVRTVKYTNIEDNYIIERVPIVHPNTKENIYKIMFVYAPSGDPYECSGNEWYIASKFAAYHKEIMYLINNEYYIKEDIPQSYMDGNSRENLEFQSTKILKYDLATMVYDYLNGRRPKYSFNDTVSWV